MLKNRSQQQSPPSLNLAFLSGTLDPRITFTRASSGTHFDSTGRLVTDTNDIARFDYDPATAAGVTGGELVTNGDFSSDTGWALTQPTSGTSSIANGQLTVQTLDGTYTAATQNITASLGKRYRATITCVSVSGTTPTFAIGAAGNTAAGTTLITTAGTHTVDLWALVSPMILEVKRSGGSTNGTAVFDGISVQEVTFTPRGLLIEEARTNLLLHSRDTTQAAWSKTDVTAARTQVGIDGAANTACLMTEGVAGNAITQQTGAAVTAGSTISGSIVVKRGNTDWLFVVLCDAAIANGANCFFNLATGAVGTLAAAGAGTGQTASVENLGGGWYRLKMSVLPNGAYTQGVMQLRSASANGSPTRVNNATYIVDTAQLEVGAFATSIITTGAATATRAADVASMTGTNFSSWAGTAPSGTLVLDVSATTTANSFYTSIGDGTGSAYIGLRWTGSSYSGIRRGPTGTPNGDVGTGVSTLANPMKMALAWDATGGSASVNGSTAVTSAIAGAVPVSVELTLGRIQVGSSVSSQQWIRSLRFYSSRLPNATLQSLTAP